MKKIIIILYRLMELPVYLFLCIMYVVYWLLIRNREFSVKNIISSYGNKVNGSLPFITIVSWLIFLFVARNYPGVIKTISIIFVIITILAVLTPKFFSMLRFGGSIALEGCKTAMKDYAYKKKNSNPYATGTIEYDSYETAWTQMEHRWPPAAQTEIEEIARKDFKSFGQSKNPYNELDPGHYIYRRAYEEISSNEI